MRKATKYLIVCAALSLLFSACSDDDDCPVCPEDNRILVYLFAGYSEAFGPFEAKYGLEASFFGDPIPWVDYFAVNDSVLSLVDADAVNPYFSFDDDSLIKSIDVTARCGGYELNRTIATPDSFAFITPLDYSVVPDDVPLLIDWEDSEGATWYQIAIDITTDELGHPLDTTFTLDSSSYLLPQELLVDGDFINIQLSSANGSVVEAGRSGNIDEPGFVGYAAGYRRVPMIGVSIWHEPAGSMTDTATTDNPERRCE